LLLRDTRTAVASFCHKSIPHLLYIIYFCTRTPLPYAGLDQFIIIIIVIIIIIISVKYRLSRCYEESFMVVIESSSSNKRYIYELNREYRSLNVTLLILSKHEAKHCNLAVPCVWVESLTF
jgi:hypothetical protein